MKKVYGQELLHATTSFGFERDDYLKEFVAHAPLIQVFGDMLTRRAKNKIQSRDDKWICLCWCVDFICIQLYMRVLSAWVVDLRAQLLFSDTISSQNLGVAVLRQSCSR